MVEAVRSWVKAKVSRARKVVTLRLEPLKPVRSEAGRRMRLAPRHARLYGLNFGSGVGYGFRAINL